MTDRSLPLDALAGEWSIVTSFAPDGPPGHMSFEWLKGRNLLLQRAEIDHPDAPDLVALIGWDEERGTYRQHYFDSRGVSRIYEMTLDDGVWTLERLEPGFCQRFRGTFGTDGRTIAGTWEFSEDGSSWRRDFDLTYTRAEN